MPNKKPARKKNVFLHGVKDKHGMSVYAMERPDTAGRVRLKIWNSERQNYDWFPLHGLCVRRADGSLDINNATKVRSIVARVSEIMLSGKTAAEAVGQSRLEEQDESVRGGSVESRIPSDEQAVVESNSDQSPPVASRGVPAAYDDQTPLSLFELMTLYFVIGSGKYVAHSRTRSDEMGYAYDVLQDVDGSTPLFKIRVTVFERVWRAFAARYAAKQMRCVYPGKRRGETFGSAANTDETVQKGNIVRWGGPTHTHKTIKFLRQLFSWAARAGFLGYTILPTANWEAELAACWQEITGQNPDASAVDIEVLRHSEEELRKLYRALDNADPRLRLLIDLAMEARLGQAVRTMRSALDLTKLPFGLLKSFGLGKKRGPEILLSEEQRRQINWEMTFGYLAPFETQYRRGLIADYPLFYGGPLSTNVDPQTRTKCLTASGVRTLFNALERESGVKHMPSRGWYGVRRSMTDLTEETAIRNPSTLPRVPKPTEEDEAALNRITGHSRSDMRHHYQSERMKQKKRDAELARGREIRGHTRRRLRGDTSEPGNPVQ
jgi:hypothetical protein